MENTTAISDSEDPFADFEDFCLLADKSCLKDFTMPPVPETSLEKAMTDNAHCENVPLLEQIKPCVEETMLRKNVFDVLPSGPTPVVNGTLDNVNNLEPMETAVKETEASLNGNSISLDDYSRKNGEFSMSDELSEIIDSLADNEVGKDLEWEGTLETSKTQEELPERTSTESEVPNKAEDLKESEEIDDFSLDLEDIDYNGDLEQKTNNEVHHPAEKMDDVPLQEKEDVRIEDDAVSPTNNVDRQEEILVHDSHQIAEEVSLKPEETAEDAVALDSEPTSKEVDLQPEKAAEEVVVLDSEPTAKVDLPSEKTADEVVVLDSEPTAKVDLPSEKTADEVVVLDSEPTAKVDLPSEKTADEVVVLDSEPTAKVDLPSEKTADEVVVLDSEPATEDLQPKITAEEALLISEMVLDPEKTPEEKQVCHTDTIDVNTDLGKAGSKSIEVSQSEPTDSSDKMTLNVEIEDPQKTDLEPQIKSSHDAAAAAATPESANEVNAEKMEIEIIKETTPDDLKNSKMETDDLLRSRQSSIDEISNPDMDAENRCSKRENEDDGDHASKKAKTEPTAAEEVLHFFEDPKNEKITITRKLLDEIVLIKVAELLTESGDFGYARTKADLTESERENLKKQKCSIMKMMDDQRKVIRKFTEDKKNLKNYTNNVIPAKVTRSVGLQVCTVGNRFVAPHKPVQPPPAPLKTFSPPVAQNLRPAKPVPMNRPLTKTTTPNKPIIMRQNARKTTTPVTPSFSPRPMNEVKAVTPRPSNDVIDLTDDPRKASQKPSLNGVKKMPKSFLQQALAPKKPELKPPFPPVPPAQYPPNTVLPPKPTLRISRTNADQKSGIMLSWHFTVKETTPISKFQVYSYQEGSESGKDVWKKVGDVDALVLPMACTLTQFKEGYKYYFSVRAIDKNSIKGPFSEPNSIKLFPRKTVNSL